MAGSVATTRGAYRSWAGNVGQSPRVHRMRWRDEPLPAPDRPMLPFGNGRSYGDSCLNDRGTLMDTRGLDRFIAFDPDSGVLRCEGGVLLAEIIEIALPRGWFVPVTPGTRFVTVGGAIANDVHGKNHHRVGSFGHHVRCLELARSDGSRRVCSATRNADWFAATIGGLGLTGLITWAEIALKRVAGPGIEAETLRFSSLDEFFDLTRDSHDDYEYTVAWVDSLADGDRLGRGLFMRGNHAALGTRVPARPRSGPGIPFTPPISLVRRPLMQAFNALYYHRPRRRSERVHYEAFFHPLDGIADWNRLYGPRGFFQYQCVVPPEAGPRAIRELLREAARAGSASCLSVLKVFGDRDPAGWLSFPRPGVTLAMDFPNRGPRTRALLDRLDDITLDAGGAVYPAKDARMSAATFGQGFPRWRRLEAYRDPRFSSNLWQRVTGGSA